MPDWDFLHRRRTPAYAPVKKMLDGLETEMVFHCDYGVVYPGTYECRNKARMSLRVHDCTSPAGWLPLLFCYKHYTLYQVAVVAAIDVYGHLPCGHEMNPVDTMDHVEEL